MSEVEEQVVGNWLPSEMSEGGMLDDKDITLRECKFSVYDYEGKGEFGPAPCFSFIPEDEDGVKGERPQYYSVGSLENWEVADDGEKVVSINANVTQLSKKSTFGRFMGSMEDAGFDFSLVDREKISSLSGLKVHLNMIPKDKGKGHYLHATKIVDTSELGGGSKKPVRKGRRSKKSAAAKAEDNGTEVAFSTEDFGNRLKEALEDRVDDIQIKDLLKVMRKDEAFSEVSGDRAYLIEGKRCLVDTEKIKELVEASGLSIENGVISLV